MRTLRYKLSGRPHNVDDCIDAVRRGHSARTTLRLRTEDMVTEMYIERGFIGEYTWQFAGRAVRCGDWYGCYRLYDPRYERDWKIRQANARLERRLAELAALGVEVAGGAARFSRSMLSAPAQPEATDAAVSASA